MGTMEARYGPVQRMWVDRTPLADDGHVGNVQHLEEHALGLGRIHLVAADVNDLAVAPAEAQPLAIDVDEVARVEEAVRVETTGRVCPSCPPRARAPA